MGKRGDSLGFLVCLSLLGLFGIQVAFVDSFSPTEHTSSAYRNSLPCLHRKVSVRSSKTTIDVRTKTTSLCSSLSQEPFGQQQQTPPQAILLVGGFQSIEEEQGLIHALRIAGFENVQVSKASRLELSEGMDDNDGVYFYELSRATGMLKLVSSSALDSNFDAPTWVPMVRGEENVLVANGWSFLDPDESEPMSAYDIDDANAESEYKPQWGDETNTNEQSTSTATLSSIGYDLSPLSKEIILSQAELLSATNEFSRDVLLHGKTDPPNTKLTSNGYDFRGATGQSDIPQGIFFTAIGGLPLFCSKDLAATTASSGWLSFGRPLDAAHVIHVTPEPNSFDQRIEVVCARSKCHLGHYFGSTEGYCINASALRFVPCAPAKNDDVLPVASRPLSWRPLDEALPNSNSYDPSLRVLKTVLETHGNYERMALGAGCFWHVEEALSNLQGVVETKACYAGGHTTAPTYGAVCEGSTGHAEVVSVVYDSEVCPTNVLVDCFLALHDPTMVKAHGKNALHTGQYRSCVFVESHEAEMIAKQCLEDCRQQLGKELSTEIRNMAPQQVIKSAPFGDGWCWRAEDEHQRHDERIQKAKGISKTTDSLPAKEWLQEYGRRTTSIMGGSLESALDPDDDGMAMMMI